MSYTLQEKEILLALLDQEIGDTQKRSDEAEDLADKEACQMALRYWRGLKTKFSNP